MGLIPIDILHANSLRATVPGLVVLFLPVLGG